MRKRIWSLGLSFIVLCTLTFFAGKKQFDFFPHSLVINIQPLRYEVRFELFYDIGKGLYGHPSIVCMASTTDRRVVFPLGVDSVRGLRIDPGSRATTMTIESVDFGLYHWSAKDIVRDFKPTNEISEYYEKDNLVHIRTAGNDPQIKYVGDIREVYEAIADTARQRTLLLHSALCLLSFFVAVMLFFWLQSIKFDGKVAAICFDGRSAKMLFVGFFVLILWLPNLANTFDFNPQIKIQGKISNETASSLTTNDLIHHPKLYESSFNNVFGFRNLLIKCNNVLRVTLLATSPDPKVLLGKDGWLFYDSDKSLWDGTTMKDYRGLAPFTTSDLEQIRRTLEERQQKLSQIGVVYVVAVAPNKNTIYGEFLPENVGRVRDTTRLDQLVAYLRTTQSKANFLDLRPALLKANSVHPTYYKTDTHWNDFGGFIAYQEVMRFLSIGIADAGPLSIDMFDVKESLGYMRQGIAAMLAMEDMLTDEICTLVPKSSIKRPLLGKLVFLHDSFGRNLDWLFAQHFDPVVDLEQDHYFDFHQIEAEKPRVVIQIIVERYLDKLR